MVSPRSLFVAVMWIVVIDCKGNEDVNPNQLFNDLENDPESGIRAIVKYLRVDDFRILPIGVSTESKKRQRQIEILENSPESILKLLSASQTTSMKSSAAEAVHLLVNENYGMAQRIGLHNWLPESHGISDLVDLVKESSVGSATATDDVVRMGEEAAQAIWALVRMSVDNLEMAIDKGAIPALMNVTMAGITPRFTMLACASLKRLLADQYSTPDGSYSSTARVMLKNDRARAQAAATPGFVRRLVDLLKAGRVSEFTPRAEWPRHAELTQRLKPSIQAWAAAAVIGTVAQNKEAREELIAAGVLIALCSMKDSPDALEQVEVMYALQGLDEDCSGEPEL